MEEETEARRRYRILSFRRKHGLQATLDAFRVSRRTRFNGQSRLAGEAAIWPASPARAGRPGTAGNVSGPHWRWPKSGGCANDIPTWAKKKIHVLLTVFCAARHTPTRLGARGQPRPARPQRLRKPKLFKAQFPGHRVALDTIERRRDGLRRDLITLTDTHSRFAFALASPTRNSAAASTVWQLAQTLFPHPITIALTDNGSEFDKHFSDSRTNSPTSTTNCSSPACTPSTRNCSTGLTGTTPSDHIMPSGCDPRYNSSPSSTTMSAICTGPVHLLVSSRVIPYQSVGLSPPMR
jgi:hypothetical protein